MSVKSQVFVIIIMFLFLIYILKSLKKKRIDLKNALGWILLLAFVIVITLIPNCITSLSKLIGISVGVNMIFFGAFSLVLFLLFKQTMNVSSLEKKIKDIVQEVAMLKNEQSLLKDEENETR